MYLYVCVSVLRIESPFVQLQLVNQLNDIAIKSFRIIISKFFRTSAANRIAQEEGNCMKEID